MNVGDLFDLLEEKLKTGEFSRMDNIVATDENGNAFDLAELSTLCSGYVQVVLEGDDD